MLAIVVAVAQLGAAAVTTQSAAGHAARLAARGEPAGSIAGIVRREAGPRATVTVRTVGDDVTATVTRPIVGPRWLRLPSSAVTARATAHREPGPEDPP